MGLSNRLRICKAIWPVIVFAAVASGQSLAVFPYDKGVRVQDEGASSSPTLVQQARGVNCRGGNITCWVDGGWWFFDADAGGAVPGGSDRQVQFNNAGAFGGTPGLLIDGGEVLMPIQTTHPAAPTGQYALPYHYSLGSSLPTNPNVLDSYFGKPLPQGWNAFFGYYGPTVAWTLYAASARGYGSSTVDVVHPTGGGALSPQSCASRNFATTSLNTRTPVLACTESGSGGGAGPGLRLNTQASGIPVLSTDFIFHSRFWIVLTFHDTLQSGRLAVGLTADSTAWYTPAGVKTDFSSAPNIVAFVVDYQQTTIHFCSNDGSGAATCADLGANFPMTTGAGYDAWIFHAANSTTVNYAMERVDSTVTPVSGSIAGDFPASGTQLVWRASMQEGADGGQVSIDWADTEILWSNN